MLGRNLARPARLVTAPITAIALSSALASCSSDSGADAPSSDASSSQSGGSSGGGGNGATDGVAKGSAGYVVHSSSGVVRVLEGGKTEKISDTDAADAYGVGSTVVFQAAAKGRFAVDGPVHIWNDGDVTDLEGSDGTRLLDAGFVDGEPVAVLVRLDGGDAAQVLAQPLEGGEPTTLAEAPAGQAAQVIAQGRIVGDAFVQLREEGDRPDFFVERFDEPGKPTWTIEAGSVSLTEIAADEQQVAVIQPAIDGRPGRNNAPLLEVTQFNPENGSVQFSEIVSLDLQPSEQYENVPTCYGFADFYLLTCGVTGEQPVNIRVPDGGLSPIVQGAKLPAGSIPNPIRLANEG